VVNFCFWQIVLKKSFLGDERNFLGLRMRFARGDVREPHRFTQNRPRTFVAAPQSVAARETSKNRLSRDFWRRLIFDFCNSIDPLRTFLTNAKIIS
jgi:hypothetical protein